MACLYSESLETNETWFKADNINVVDLPARVASVMQDYADTTFFNWPNSYNSRQGQIERERVTITIKDGNTKYQFKVIDQDYVLLTKDSDPINKQSIPGPVLNVAQNFIPGNPDYPLGT